MCIGAWFGMMLLPSDAAEAAPPSGTAPAADDAPMPSTRPLLLLSLLFQTDGVSH